LEKRDTNLVKPIAIQSGALLSQSLNQPRLVSDTKLHAIAKLF